MEYIIIIEKSKNGYGAYAPDFPGVGVVGDTKQEVIKLIKKSIKMQIEEITNSEIKIPRPRTEIMKLKSLK
ncbi:MAG: type II toxin-antitoxin system HicB family antitoxin [Ignavibacteria bacterium]